MRYFDINNKRNLYDRDSRTVSNSRTGFDPISETELMKHLAAAIVQREALFEAIADMKEMLGIPEEVEHE